jgi:hypothetical protein
MNAVVMAVSVVKKTTNYEISRIQEYTHLVKLKNLYAGECLR